MAPNSHVDVMNADEETTRIPTKTGNDEPNA